MESFCQGLFESIEKTPFFKVKIKSKLGTEF